MTVGFWWQWQDLNLRPWDYDSPALSESPQKSRFFFEGGGEIRGQDLGDNIS